MSSRAEILDGSQAAKSKKGLVYTEVLGWIDLGHAQGTDIKNLLKQFSNGENSTNDFYEVTYSQCMNGLWGQISSGKATNWRIRRSRPLWEQKSIALAMMMALSLKFEKFQGNFLNSLVTDSGFSGEDLVSNLLGFYRTVSAPDPFTVLRPVSKQEALKRWDFYGKIGNWKNHSFQPLLFPDPDKKSNPRPIKGSLPPFMQSVIPYNDFLSGNVILPKYDKTIIVLGSGSSRLK